MERADDMGLHRFDNQLCAKIGGGFKVSTIKMLLVLVRKVAVE